MAVDYSSINARAVNLLLSVKKHTASIEPELKSLLELRVSQINGCAYCVDLHIREARKAGVSEQLLDCLVVWKESGLFTERQMAALRWSEAITLITEHTDKEVLLTELLEQFSETEAVDLTLIVSLMNCMNRMAIGFGDKPASLIVDG